MLHFKTLKLQDLKSPKTWLDHLVVSSPSFCLCCVGLLECFACIIRLKQWANSLWIISLPCFLDVCGETLSGCISFFPSVCFWRTPFVRWLSCCLPATIMQESSSSRVQRRPVYTCICVLVQRGWRLHREAGVGSSDMNTSWDHLRSFSR